MQENFLEKKFWNICFTMFDMNYNFDELIKICNYLIKGKETCPDTGRPHFQCYAELKSQKTGLTLQKILKGAHFASRYKLSTAKQASDYCKKEGDFEEYGEMKQQGKRNDIISTYAAAESNVKFETFLRTETPNLQNLRIFQIAKQAFQKDRDFKPEVFWYYGATGSGKTRSVVERESDLWISGKNLRWWEGYENQEAVLFDDFRKDFCTFHELLRILDRYPYTVEIKGGHAKLNSKRMYITSCYSPYEMYDTREDVQQLIRRITHIKKFSEVPFSEVGEVILNSPPICYLDED